MSTARSLITRALRLIHVLDTSEVPTADEAQDSLEALNDMLDTMSIPGLYVFSTRQDSVSWPAATRTRTIGTGGHFAITRPTKILDGSFVTLDGNDYPLTVIRDRAAYAGIVDKNTDSTLPQWLYYEPSFPTGTIYLHPVPSAGVTLELLSEQQLTQFTTIDDTFTYPPGYREMMVSNLAVRLAPEFGVAVPPETAELARRSSATVRRLNGKSPSAVLEVSAIGGSPSYSIYSDTP